MKRLATRQSLSADLLAVFSSELAANAHMFGSTDITAQELTAILHKAAEGQSIAADDLIPLAPLFAKYLDIDEIPSGTVAPTGSVSEEKLSNQYSSQWNTLMPAKELVQMASFVGSLSFSFLPTPIIRNSLKSRIERAINEDKVRLLRRRSYSSELTVAF